MSFPGARAGQARPLRLWADDGWIALLAPVLIFLACLLYGAMPPQTALTFSAIWGLLAADCLLRPRLRGDLIRLDGLAVPAGLFAAVVLVILLSLTPYAPGGPHPTWAYLGISPGAATVDKSATQVELLKLLGLACVFVVGLATGGSDARARLAVNTLLALGAAYAVWSFLAFVVTRAPGTTRLEASFLSANTAGTLFAVLFVVTIGPLASRLRDGGQNRLTGAALPITAAFLFLVCLFMTASRGALVGAISGLLAFGALQVLVGRSALPRALLAGGAAAIALLVLLALAGDFMLTRMVGSSDTVASRAVVGHIHWEAFLTSPLMGFGLGSFDTINRTLLDTANFQEAWSVRAAHNIYLGWLEQAGLLGALPMFACLGALILTTVRKASRRSRSTSLIFSLVAADVVFLVHGATDFALEMFAMGALCAYLLGLQFSLAQGSSSR